VERSAEPPVPRSGREQLALVERGSEVFGRGPGKNGEQQRIVDNEHEAKLAWLEIGDVGIDSRRRICQPAIGAVAKQRGNGPSLLLAERGRVGRGRRPELSGAGDRFPGTIDCFLKGGVKMNRAGGHAPTVHPSDE
jgi:hypothetical protein